MRKTFTPKITPNAADIINSVAEDMYFIMEQHQPGDFYDPEAIDLQPHCIRSIGNYEQICKWWDTLETKIRTLHQAEEVEIFSHGEGRDFVNIVVFNGNDVITLTVCAKEKALALAM